MGKRAGRRLFEAAEILKAIANPVRLSILQSLSGRELCVGELVKLSGVGESTVSRHLSRMRNAGILDSRKQKNSVYYRIRAATVSVIRKNVEFILINKVRKLKSLCRTVSRSVLKNRRK